MSSNDLGCIHSGTCFSSLVKDGERLNIFSKVNYKS